MKPILLLGVSTAVLASASAQALPRRSSPPQNVIVEAQPNITGNGRGEIIARGPTGADTIFTNSAAGGNAGQPERAIPLGSAGGGDSGGSP